MSIRFWFGAVAVCVPTIASVVCMTAGGAFAQNAPTCSCIVPASEVGSAVGLLRQVHGNVQMSRAGGYEGVKADTAVFAGARILTGSQSSASLSMGANCALDIPANATVKVDPTQGGMCVSLSSPEATVVPASTGPKLVPILLGGGAVGGAAVLILSLHDDDNSASE